MLNQYQDQPSLRNLERLRQSIAKTRCDGVLRGDVLAALDELAARRRREEPAGTAEPEGDRPGELLSHLEKIITRERRLTLYFLDDPQTPDLTGYYISSGAPSRASAWGATLRDALAADRAARAAGSSGDDERRGGTSGHILKAPDE